MRKLYTATFLVLSASMMAQQAMKTPVRGTFVPEATKPTAAPAIQKGSNCVWEEDFEGGAIPAGWDIGAQVEQQTDAPNGVGLGTFVDAWVVGNSAAANNGTFLPIPNQPPGNLFAYANDDGDPCNCDMSDVNLTTPSIDLSGQSNLGMYMRVYHDGNYAPSEASIQGSNDGGATWNTIVDLPEVTGAWQSITVILADYEGFSDVKFRFHFTDGNGWGTGMAVDDLCISTLPNNDLVLGGAFLVDQLFNYDTPGYDNIEYPAIPLEQARPLRVAADVVNYGAAAQPNVVLTAEVFENNVSVGSYTSNPYPSLAAGMRDSLVILTGWTPSAIGDVRVEFSVVSDSVDANPGDNARMRHFQVTGPSAADGWNRMAVDTGAMDSRFDLSQNTNYSVAGCQYRITNSGSMCYGVGVVFSNRTTPGSVVNVQLQDTVNLVGEAIAFEVMPYHTGAAGNSNYVMIPFDGGPVALDANTDYTVFVENPGGDTVSVGTSGLINPGGLRLYDNADATLYRYVGYGNPAPMIALILANAPSAVLEQAELGLSVANNMPNPFSDVTMINFELKESSPVSIQVVDVNGRLVFQQNLGNRSAGNHNYVLNGSTFAPGVYHYTLSAGETRISHSMVVAR